jgi:hypothetical protein
MKLYYPVSLMVNNFILPPKRFFSWLLGMFVIISILPPVLADTDCNATICTGNNNNCQRVSLMPVAQCETLLNLYHHTNGLAWKNNTGWNVTNEPRDFTLIVTRPDGPVTALNLFENYLNGSLPDLSALSSLEVLNLYENQLTGTLPPLNLLSNLKVINLRNNHLQGPLPDLSLLTQLEILSLYHNELCGPIPNLSSLTQLRQLDLSYNHFTGAIPDLRQLPKLRSVGLKGNQLCRDNRIDYSGFEYAVNAYPSCSPDMQYPACTPSTSSPPTSVDSFPLTLSKQGDGDGQITGEGIDCGNDCEEQYPPNTIVTLTALPAANSIFSNWGGACSGRGTNFSGGPPYCQLTMNQAQSVIVNFAVAARSEYTLTVNKGSNGNGSITAEGITCGSDCSQVYARDTLVTLAAAPASDSTFAGWTGACAGNQPLCQVVMSQDQNVTASFNFGATQPAYSLTVNKTGEGNGKVVSAGIDCGEDCSEQYGNNAVVMLSAQPATDSKFVGWSGACGGMSTICQVTIKQNQTVTANFESLPPPVETAIILTVSKEGMGTGTVTAADIACGTICTAKYALNTTVTLNAVPIADSSFAGWRGDCTGTTPTCQLIMSQNQTVIATFNRISATNDNNTTTDNTTTLPINSASVELLEFVGLKPLYQVGELFILDLVEHVQTPLRAPRVDLWVAIEYPDQTFHYLTELPFQVVSTLPQPYRRNLPSIELTSREERYHLLYFDVPPNSSGTYNFYAIYNQADADLSNLLFTQQSTIAFASTFISNDINPTTLTTIPENLSMIVGEKLELVVDSAANFEAILSTCQLTPLGIVQSYSGLSSTGVGVSCYLTGLQSGETWLTTTDKNGQTTATHIIVR